MFRAILIGNGCHQILRRIGVAYNGAIRVSRFGHIAPVIKLISNAVALGVLQATCEILIITKSSYIPVTIHGPYQLAVLVIVIGHGIAAGVGVGVDGEVTFRAIISEVGMGRDTGIVEGLFGHPPLFIIGVLDGGIAVKVHRFPEVTIGVIAVLQGVTIRVCHRN